VDVYRQVGVNTDSILKAAKPADLPVCLQSTKFEFVVNQQTGASARDRRAAALLAIVDEAIK
jgi:hypothetical protein